MPCLAFIRTEAAHMDVSVILKPVAPVEVMQVGTPTHRVFTTGAVTTDRPNHALLRTCAPLGWAHSAFCFWRFTCHRCLWLFTGAFRFWKSEKFCWRLGVLSFLLRFRLHKSLSSGAAYPGRSADSPLHSSFLFRSFRNFDGFPKRCQKFTLIPVQRCELLT